MSEFRFLQVDRKGKNTPIKNFLDSLEKLGVEHSLDVNTEGVNKITFTVTARPTTSELMNFRRAIREHFSGGKKKLTK